MKKLFVMMLVLSLSGVSVHASSFAERCADIAMCAAQVSEILKQKYILAPDISGKIQATPNLELTKENAEVLFTNALYLNGYSRVPLGTDGTFQIVRVRDARDSAIPLVKSQKMQPPNLPDTWDLMTLEYKSSNPEGVEEMARTCRSFMPANSRIIPVELSGTLLVTDAAANLKKIYAMLKDMDQPASLALKKKWAEHRRGRGPGPKGSGKPGPSTAPTPTVTE